MSSTPTEPELDDATRAAANAVMRSWATWDAAPGSRQNAERLVEADRELGDRLGMPAHHVRAYLAGARRRGLTGKGSLTELLARSEQLRGDRVRFLFAPVLAEFLAWGGAGCSPGPLALRCAFRAAVVLPTEVTVAP